MSPNVHCHPQGLGRRLAKFRSGSVDQSFACRHHVHAPVAFNVYRQIGNAPASPHVSRTSCRPSQTTRLAISERDPTLKRPAIVTRKSAKLADTVAVHGVRG